MIRSAPGLLCCVLVLAVIIGYIGIRRSRRRGGPDR
jgi:hypothetical protein